MKYYKSAGTSWDSYYAIDEDNKAVSTVEVRFESPSRTYIDTYLVSNYSAEKHTYDPIATQAVIDTCTQITKKEWEEVKKDCTAFIRYIEDKFQ